jgi:hypothetical protein
VTKKAQLLALLDRHDQENIREDLKNYFGPRAETYLATYEKMRAGSGGRRIAPMTWSWPGFLLSYAWFFYRKMYIYGAIFLLVPIIMALLFPSASVALYVCSALLGKSLYVQAGLNRIMKADAVGLSGQERKHYFERAGRVSILAGGIGCLIFVAAAAFAIYGAFAESHRM